ncbi:MAG: glycosyltransferase family 2 protein [Rhodospirillales bacterium]
MIERAGTDVDKRQRGSRLIACSAALIVLVLHAGVWLFLRETASPPSALNAVSSLSYTIGPPDDQFRPLDDATRARINRELAAITTISRGIRIYSSRGRNAEVPAIAREHGLSVTAGAWIGGDAEENTLEVQALLKLVNRNPNIREIIVGNETLLRRELPVADLIELLRKVRHDVRQPVSTAETWDIWLKFPELVREVDYIAIHVLPYWEGISDTDAISFTMDRLQDIRDAYPGKRIVIAEFGWPSKGHNNRAADVGPTIQARIIREFVRTATDRSIAFNIIEAFDQPWKTREGSVGAYWGLFDTSGQLKFPLEGDFRDTTFYPRLLLAMALGLLSSLVGLALIRSTFGHALVFSLACNALAAPMSLALMYPVENYLNIGSAIAWVFGIILMVPLSLMTLVKVHEVADVILGFPPKRLIEAYLEPPVGYRWPKVSVHVPAYRESPAVLIETLESIATLTYPDYEVLVIINNTPEEALWRPVEEACKRLGPQFRFLNLMNVKGFKAGALNLALEHMDPAVEVIALLDADYTVTPSWLRDLVPAFDDPAIALVQAPQDHRDGGESFLKTVMNSEYTGFFDIGMVQRNENDAVIAHGTMLLLRRSAFDKVGGWATDTITEDTELGLRLFEAGYSALYTNHRYGFGILPDTLQAFMTQRHRWAYGAMQIIRKHWRHMMPKSPTLKAAQKAQFVTGWCYWLSDAFGVLAAFLNLLWVPMILFVGVLIPMLPFTLPILAMFIVNLLHCFILHLVRVRISPQHILSAALAAMSLQMTVGKAVWEGLTGIQIGFRRTEKGGVAKRSLFPAKREAWLGALLMVGASAIFFANTTEALETNIFAATLVVQSLPFLAAAGLGLFERYTTQSDNNPAAVATG